MTGAQIKGSLQHVQGISCCASGTEGSFCDIFKLNDTENGGSEHWTYQRTNPKTVTWSRNFQARIHSAVHLVNRGLADSTVSKMKAAGVLVDSRVLQHLQRQHRRDQYLAAYKRTVTYKQRNRQRLVKRYKLYDARSKVTESVTYQSGLAMPIVHKKRSSCDHSYAKMCWNCLFLFMNKIWKMTYYLFTWHRSHWLI